jgi:hypothetical protein
VERKFFRSTLIHSLYTERVAIQLICMQYRRTWGPVRRRLYLGKATQSQYFTQASFAIFSGLPFTLAYSFLVGLNPTSVVLQRKQLSLPSYVLSRVCFRAPRL